MGVAATTAVTPTVRVGSGTVTILLGGEATDGAFALFEEVTDPGGSLPLHRHERETEAFFILEGHFEFLVGDRTVTAGPGAFLVVPRGAPHKFRNLDDTPARKLSLVWPLVWTASSLKLASRFRMPPLRRLPRQRICSPRPSFSRRWRSMG